MFDNLANNKRIAKNTLMLYIRMFLIMSVNLYTSRIILKALGVEDFGLYNIVGGIVVLFAFINNAMVASTQRFLNYELGRNNQEEARKVFSVSLSIHFIIAFVFLLFAETIGLWFLNTYIQIPVGRELAANWVYQFTIITSIINIIRTPYNASIIAYEKMSFYAYISVIEVLLKLLVVFLIYLFVDRLISYAALVALVAFIVLGCYYIFCKKNFSICEYKFEYDKQRYLAIASFSGWSLFGSVANIGGQQGTNILLNLFFGVTVNAAMGVANQVNSAIYQFVGNFQTAFNPQIIKLYAAGEKVYFVNLILNTSRYSFLLLFLLALPVYICTHDILYIWLDSVPEYTVEFCRLMLIFSLIDSIQGPLWVSAQATGRIRNYQLLMSSLILLNIPIIYVLFLFFEDPILALIVRICINLLVAVARVLYLNKLYDFPIMRFLREVVFICSAIVFCSSIIPYLLSISFSGSLGMLISIVFSLFCSVFFIFLFGLKRNEKKLVLNKINQYIKI